MFDFLNKKNETIEIQGNKKMQNNEVQMEEPSSSFHKDSWIAGADAMKKQNEKIWSTLTHEEIKDKILKAAQNGDVYEYFFNRILKKEDKMDLTELGYKVEEGFHHDAPYVKVSWK